MYRNRKRSYNTSFPVRKRRPTYASGRNLGTLPSSRGFAPYYGTRRRRNTSTRAVEMKYFDKLDQRSYVAQNPTSVGAGAGVVCLFTPQLGTDATSRIGRKVVVRKLFIRGRMFPRRLQYHVSGDPPVAELLYGYSEPQQCRIVILWDMQPNGTVPLYTDVFTDGQPQAQLNLNYRDRFSIVKDKVISFDAVTALPGITAQTPILEFNTTISNVKIFKKFKKEVIFNGSNGGTYADIASGALWMFLVGSGAITNFGEDASIFLWSSRVRYEDS